MTKQQLIERAEAYARRVMYDHPDTSLTEDDIARAYIEGYDECRQDEIHRLKKLMKCNDTHHTT